MAVAIHVADLMEDVLGLLSLSFYSAAVETVDSVAAVAAVAIAVAADAVQSSGSYLFFAVVAEMDSAVN